MKNIIKKGVFSLLLPMMLGSSITTTVLASSDPYLGEISYVAFNYAPRGWAKCDGQLLAISNYTALFSLLGTTYGGDGRTTFALPDMRGRAPLHQGNSPGYSSYRMGQKGGQESATLGINQLPSHSHASTATSLSTSTVATGATATSTLKAYNGNASLTTASGSSLATTGRNVYNSVAPNVNMHAGSVVTTIDGLTINTNTNTTVAINNTGGSQSFSIMQPYTTLNCIIALEGIFPPRN